MLDMLPVPGVFIAGLALFLVVVWDAFEAIILPRRVTRKFRLTRLYYLFTWRSWKFYASLIPKRKARETFLGFYGPMSLLFLIGVWAIGLVFAARLTNPSSFTWRDYLCNGLFTTVTSKSPVIHPVERG